MRHRTLGRFLLCAVAATACFAGVPAQAADPAAPTPKKRAYTVQEVNKAKRFVKKPKLVLSWQSRVKLANDALSRDAARVKAEVDGVLARAEQKSRECSTDKYTLQDLQALCRENEGVQACLDRLMTNCFMANAQQQASNSMANALAAMNIKTYLDRLRSDIDNLEQALYK